MSNNIMFNPAKAENLKTVVTEKVASIRSTLTNLASSVDTAARNKWEGEHYNAYKNFCARAGENAYDYLALWLKEINVIIDNAAQAHEKSVAASAEAINAAATGISSSMEA